MKKKFLLITTLAISALGYSQVGINNQAPQATLDVTAKNSTGTSTAADGVLLPRIDRQRAQSMSLATKGTLIYVNDISKGTQTDRATNIDAEGFYYYNGSNWQKMDQNTNLYNANGTLTADRTVTHSGKKLYFDIRGVNDAFQVNGQTFTIDGDTNRLGMGTDNPLSVLHVVNAYPGNQRDLLYVGMNNCGGPCGQGTPRNVVLFNANATNGQFGNINFVPTTNPDGETGAAISGIDRDRTNSRAGISILTNGEDGFNHRLTVKSSGLVGINNSNPSQLLDVNGISTFRNNVGINVISPTEKLHVNGNGLFTGTVTATNITAPSDIRIKKDIKENTYGLKEVMKINTIRYKYKDENLSKDKKIGVIAQEIQKLIPELVVTGNDENKTLSVNYSELTVVLLKSIQEQQAEIDELKKELSQLKK